MLSTDQHRQMQLAPQPVAPCGAESGIAGLDHTGRCKQYLFPVLYLNN